MASDSGRRWCAVCLVRHERSLQTPSSLRPAYRDWLSKRPCAVFSDTESIGTSPVLPCGKLRGVWILWITSSIRLRRHGPHEWQAKVEPTDSASSLSHFHNLPPCVDSKNVRVGVDRETRG